MAFDQIERAEFAGVEDRADGAGFAVQPVRLVGHQLAAGFAGGAEHRFGFGGTERQRFVAEDVAAGAHRPDRLVGVKNRGRSDHHEIGMQFFEHRLEVGIEGGNSEAGLRFGEPLAAGIDDGDGMESIVRTELRQVEVPGDAPEPGDGGTQNFFHTMVSCR